MRYLFLVVALTISNADRTKILDKIHSQLKDNVVIKASDLPTWQQKTNTNKQFKVLCLDITGKKLPWTQAQAEAWTQANLDEPNKVNWVVGENNQVLHDGGIEPVPSPDIL